MGIWDQELSKFRQTAPGAPAPSGPSSGMGPIPYAPGATDYGLNRNAPQAQQVGGGPQSHAPLPAQAPAQPASQGVDMSGGAAQQQPPDMSTYFVQAQLAALFQMLMQRANQPRRY